MIEPPREKVWILPPSVVWWSPFRRCSNQSVVALEAVRLNSSGLMSQQTKTEKFVFVQKHVLQTLLNHGGCTELPWSQYQRADGSLAEEQRCTLVR